MAEIKSAIELAMERTRNLVMDDEEKKESEKKEIENRVRAILRRYLENMIEAEGVMAEMDEIRADGGLKRKLLIGLLVEDIDIAGENSRMFDLFRRVSGGLPASFVEELESMRREFTLEMEKKKSAVRRKVWQRLGEMGITGDGLEPNVEAWEEWSDARDETGRIFGKRAGEWKERLAGVLDKG